MSPLVPSSALNAEPGRTLHAGASRAPFPVMGAILGHALIWTVLPALFLATFIPIRSRPPIGDGISRSAISSTRR